MAQPVFPQNIKEWTDKQDHIDDVFAGDINGAYAELIAIQKYLKPLIDTGVANAYSATVPNVTEYFDGLMVTLKIANSNTGSSTLNINDLGAKPIKKEKDVDLAANDIKAGQYVTFVYDGTNFQMVSAFNGLVSHKNDGAQHAKTARFVIGTSTAGWTAADCDYLCDGTNDQEEIIQALNALPATGGEVVILDGTYNITASIHIPKDNVSIRGSGNATTLKRMYNSTNTDSGSTARGLITLNEKSGCKIQGLQIDGYKATYTASYNYGISLISSSDNTVTGNTCINNSYGIYLYSSSDNTITGNTCNNNSSSGIHLYSSSNNTITGNTCNNNDDGIHLYSSSNNNIITGNTCNSNNIGIYLYSSSNNTITGNTCNNNSRGISLSSSSNNTITGNTCNNNESGIYLTTNSNNNTITGNTCIRGTGQPSDYTSSQYTIHLSGSSNSYNLISSNNCMGKDVVIGGGTSNTSVNNKYN